jgi:purine-nucleoside phosphorylase
LQPQLRLRDLVIAQAASTDSNFGSQFGLGGHIAGVPDFALLQRAVRTAEALGLAHHVGHVLSSDFFYHADPENWKKWQKMGVLCVEMEAYALFLTATKLGAKALCITTISDSLVSGENLSQEARQLSFADMARLALALV